MIQTTTFWEGSAMVPLLNTDLRVHRSDIFPWLIKLRICTKMKKSSLFVDE